MSKDARHFKAEIERATEAVREFGRILGSEWGACSSCGTPLTFDQRTPGCPFTDTGECQLCAVCHRQSVWSLATELPAREVVPW